MKSIEYGPFRVIYFTIASFLIHNFMIEKELYGGTWIDSHILLSKCLSMTANDI